MFSLNFNKDSKYLFEADELRINYHEDLSSLGVFCGDHSHQRIVLNITTSSSLDIIDPITSQYPNLSICAAVQPRQIHTQTPLFFDAPAASWDQLHYLLSLGISQVRVTGEICFDMIKLAAVVHAASAKLRICPNLAQGASHTPSLKKFFIRPEDIPLYSPFVDIFEFAPSDTEDTYFNIYKNKKWFGKLNEIIFDLDNDIDNRFLTTHFGEYRLKCGKRCFKGSSCNLCNSAYSLSSILGGVPPQTP